MVSLTCLQGRYVDTLRTSPEGQRANHASVGSCHMSDESGLKVDSGHPRGGPFIIDKSGPTTTWRDGTTDWGRPKHVCPYLTPSFKNKPPAPRAADNHRYLSITILTTRREVFVHCWSSIWHLSIIEDSPLISPPGVMSLSSGDRWANVKSCLLHLT